MGNSFYLIWSWLWCENFSSYILCWFLYAWCTKDALGLEAISFAFSFIHVFNILLLKCVLLGSRDSEANEAGLTLCAELKPIWEQYGSGLQLSHAGGRNQSAANGGRQRNRWERAFKVGPLGSHSWLATVRAKWRCRGAIPLHKFSWQVFCLFLLFKR